MVKAFPRTYLNMAAMTTKEKKDKAEKTTLPWRTAIARNPCPGILLVAMKLLNTYAILGSNQNS